MNTNKDTKISSKLKQTKVMTKQEFQEMTGLTVDEEQMWGIHEAYITS